MILRKAFDKAATAIQVTTWVQRHRPLCTILSIAVAVCNLEIMLGKTHKKDFAVWLGPQGSCACKREQSFIFIWKPISPRSQSMPPRWSPLSTYTRKRLWIPSPCKGSRSTHSPTSPSVHVAATGQRRRRVPGRCISLPGRLVFDIASIRYPLTPQIA